MSNLTKQQKNIICDFMAELAKKTQDDFYKKCKDIGIDERLMGEKFMFFLTITIGQLIGGSYDDEVEIFDISQTIRKKITDVACKYQKDNKNQAA